MTSKVRVAQHRDRLRAAGLRPVQFLVADLRQETVRVEVRRQAAAVAGSRTTLETLGQLDGLRCLSVEPWVTSCIAWKAP
jgi:hypothetical protein